MTIVHNVAAKHAATAARQPQGKGAIGREARRVDTTSGYQVGRYGAHGFEAIVVVIVPVRWRIFVKW